MKRPFTAAPKQMIIRKATYIRYKDKGKTRIESEVTKAPFLQLNFSH
jgi:hypothetical protein